MVRRPGVLTLARRAGFALLRWLSCVQCLLGRVSSGSVSRNPPRSDDIRPPVTLPPPDQKHDIIPGHGPFQHRASCPPGFCRREQRAMMSGSCEQVRQTADSPEWWAGCVDPTKVQGLPGTGRTTYSTYKKIKIKNNTILQSKARL